MKNRCSQLRLVVNAITPKCESKPTEIELCSSPEETGPQGQDDLEK